MWHTLLPALPMSAHFAQITWHTSHAQLHASAIAMAGKHAQTRSSTRAQSSRHCVHAARHASNAAMHAPMRHAPCFCVPRELAVKPPRECTCVHMHTPPATRPAAAPPPRPVVRPTGRRQRATREIACVNAYARTCARPRPRAPPPPRRPAWWRVLRGVVSHPVITPILTHVQWPRTTPRLAARPLGHGRPPRYYTDINPRSVTQTRIARSRPRIHTPY